MNRKIFTSLVFFIFVSLIFSKAFALTSEQKWAILSNFQKEQESMLFEGEFDMWSFSANDLFKVTSKISIFENIQNKVEDKRIELENKRENILTNILSIEHSITTIDEDILSLVKETNKINAEIVDTSRKINANETQIDILNIRIEKSEEVLRDYTVYLYKKWNLILNDWEIDNLKAIILNSNNLDEVINDIYFKEIISVAWKKLIDKHKRYIFSLYVEQKDLEEASKRLKILRKDFIIKKKVLNDKKDFKERLLKESKWKDSLYKKYIQEQIDIEKELKIKAFKEKIKFNEISKDLLWKYDCKFVDISKNTPELRTLSEKCFDLNKMLYAESKLLGFSKNSTNVFSWPVVPSEWISAYYHDPEYKKDFHQDHDGTDIVIDQWSNIAAPADGYVIYIEEPDSSWYAYIALRHADWFVTVYWHINESLVKKYDFIKAWEIFAKTWGEYWTNWAWYLTTWAHLHFEVFKDKNRRDALEFLNISYLKFDNLPEKYRFKFYADYKEKNGREYKDKVESWSKVFKLNWTTEIERQKSLLDEYARSDFANWDMWIEEALDWNVDPTFLMCIWLAESGLWRNLKTSYNVWNIWNTDSGGTWDFTNPRQWIYWMWKTLNNSLLWGYDAIKDLSRYGNKTWPIYASSPDHWHNNIIKCMSFIKWRYVPDDYNFRLNH